MASKQAEYSRAYKDRLRADPERWAAYQAKRREYANAHYRSHVKPYKLMKQYGLTMAEYEVMLVRQNGVCAICQGPDPDGRDLAVDHSHETGRVRGLLCRSCNTMLGFIEMTGTDGLSRIQSYLAGKMH